MKVIDNVTNILDNIVDSLPSLFESEESTYFFGTRKVPRVTKIIQRCIHNDRLMTWANSLGFQRQSYSKVLANAATIGTQCHENINRFFVQPASVDDLAQIMAEARFAYESFQRWYNEISIAARVCPIAHEKTLACKYFGGTLDGLYSINDKLYLIDYKTSNHVTFSYCLQLAAYAYMLEEIESTKIDGCILLQLSKSSIEYNEFVIDFTNPNHYNYIDQCKTSFLSAVLWYYELCLVEKGYNILQWS